MRPMSPPPIPHFTVFTVFHSLGVNRWEQSIAPNAQCDANLRRLHIYCIRQDGWHAQIGACTLRKGFRRGPCFLGSSVAPHSALWSLINSSSRYSRLLPTRSPLLMFTSLSGPVWPKCQPNLLHAPSVQDTCWQQLLKLSTLFSHSRLCFLPLAEAAIHLCHFTGMPPVTTDQINLNLPTQFACTCKTLAGGI